jgi:LysR family transcriptional regulator, flagellar master operon regulator
MDTELLKTFLEINKTRHFGRAASNLYLTQSAISARMRLLEQTIGMPLFTRNRNDIQLTPSGRKLLPHAEAMLDHWTRIQHEIALHEEEQSSLHLGAELPLAELVFPTWVRKLWEEEPALALRIGIFTPQTLVPQLLEGALDLALSFGPTADTTFKDYNIGSLNLALYSTSESDNAERLIDSPNYVHAEWGTWLDIQFAKAFPDITPGGLRTPSIHLILELLANNDGACYLPRNLLPTERYASLGLHPIVHAPTFEQEIFASYALDSPQRGAIEEMMHKLRDHAIID